MLKDELTRILDQVPPHTGYVTVPRKLLARILSDLLPAPVPQPTNGALTALERHLTKAEYLLMKTLWECPYRCRSVGTLVCAANVQSREALWVLINRLRVKLTDCAPMLRIVTVRGKGYYLATEEEE